MIPLVWTLVARARRAHRQREAMLQRAMDASLDERRRIAATLHDGVVQELAAASFAVAGSAQDAAARGDHDLAERLRVAGDAVRSSIGGMRSLLVDIYPPSLKAAGLVPALRDLAATARMPVELDVDEDLAQRLPADAPGDRVPHDPGMPAQHRGARTCASSAVVRLRSQRPASPS